MYYIFLHRFVNDCKLGEVTNLRGFWGMNTKENKRTSDEDYQLKKRQIIVEKRNRNFKRIIFLFLAIVGIFAIILFYSRIQINIFIKAAESTTKQIAERVALNLATSVKDAQKCINGVAIAIASNNDFDETISSETVIKQHISYTPFESIEYVRADGMNIINGGEAFDASERPYYQEGIKGNSGVWVNRNPKYSKENLVNFYAPIIRDNQVRGVITGYIPAKTEWSSLLQNEFFGQKMIGILYDKDGNLICSTEQSEFIPNLTIQTLFNGYGFKKNNKDIFISLLLESENQVEVYHGPNGEGRLFVAPVEGTDWKIAIIIPAKSFSNVVGNYFRNAVFSVAGISLILALYFLYIILSFISENKIISKENTELEYQNRLYNEQNQRVFERLKLMNADLEAKQCELEQVLQSEREQYSVLKSMAGVFYSMHILDLKKDRITEFYAQNEVQEIVSQKLGAKETVEKVMKAVTRPEYLEAALKFTDLTTLPERMKGKKLIDEEFIGNRLGWFRMQFIAMDSDEDEKPKKVIVTTYCIDEEKKQKERLIYYSKTDELTGFFNRRAYEEDISRYENDEIEDDFIYITFDLNGLKMINDTLGHIAGDEMLVGACECMRSAFGNFGKLYRTGGDEFVALLWMDEETLKTSLCSFESEIKKWRGKLVESLTVSFGTVKRRERPNDSIREISILSDQRMYDAKADYYKKRGIDRRIRNY